MTRAVKSTPAFDRVAKRLVKQDKAALDDAIKALMADPGIGEMKKGDLAGVCIHKFKINKQEKLLAYTVSADAIVLLALGAHENFYRDLKR